MLGDDELLKSPYNIDNQAHRRAVLAELDRVRTLGVKPPQNLWEYKVREAVHCLEALIRPNGTKGVHRLFTHNNQHTLSSMLV